MADITWIKLRTNMFDDEKIRLIERMPEGDAILIIWIKLLSYAGKVNCNGYIMINENIPMNTEQIAIIFNRPFEKVKYAISVLEKFGMLDVSEDEVIAITNWEKHQNVEGMDKIREQNRERKRLERERKKQLSLTTPISEPCHVTVTQGHATEIDIEIDKDKDIKPSSQKFSTLDMENAELLFSLILENNPDAKKPNLEKWANEFRLIRTADKREDKTIKYLVNWCQKDSFWKSNILSPAKLRKQWDQLYLKAKQEYERASKPKQQVLNKPWEGDLYGTETNSYDNANNFEQLPKSVKQIGY